MLVCRWFGWLVLLVIGEICLYVLVVVFGCGVVRCLCCSCLGMNLWCIVFGWRCLCSGIGLCCDFLCVICLYCIGLFVCCGCLVLVWIRLFCC